MWIAYCFYCPPLQFESRTLRPLPAPRHPTDHTIKLLQPCQHGQQVQSSGCCPEPPETRQPCHETHDYPRYMRSAGNVERPSGRMRSSWTTPIVPRTTTCHCQAAYASRITWKGGHRHWPQQCLGPGRTPETPSTGTSRCLSKSYGKVDAGWVPCSCIRKCPSSGGGVAPVAVAAGLDSGPATFTCHRRHRDALWDVDRVCFDSVAGDYPVSLSLCLPWTFRPSFTRDLSFSQCDPDGRPSDGRREIRKVMRRMGKDYNACKTCHDRLPCVI